MRIGYFLSSEEHGPGELLRQARMAEEAGFRGLWISDHFHPWNNEQGQSPFVWTVIGAIGAATRLPVTTAVTCPTVRIHPAIVAQAAATCASLLDGRFVLGVGSGEALNEHILGDPWPSVAERQEMLEESVALMRELWSGRQVNFDGNHYKVVDARIYTLPDQPPPIYVSAFGEKSARLAGEIGDGLVSTMPDPSLLETFRKAGGAGRPTQAGFKVCYGSDEAAARRTAYRLWANEQLPGQLAQTLPLPAHFEQASTLVTEEMVGEAVVCGPDPERHVEQLRKYLDAGYDEVYVNQIGPDQDAFFRFYAEQILPKVH